MNDYDVVVIGAGFAGATAARECATRDLRTLVLEGRDRVGGRTWTARLSDGELIELGGTYVHWVQPHVWSEITRYELARDLVEAAEPIEWVLAPRGDGLDWYPYEEHERRERALFEQVFEPSPQVFPLPHDPLHARDSVAEWDRLSIRDRLNQLDLAADDEALLLSLFSTETADASAEGSFLSLLRWWAPAGHNYDAMQAAVFGYMLKSGTVSLLEAILADGGAELRLGSPVTRIEQDDERVLITCADGEFSAGAAVVATPTGVWPHLEFSPPLSDVRIEAARAGMQAVRAAKVIAVSKGERRRISVQPPPGHPIGAMWTSHLRTADEQVAVVFASPAMSDARDISEVRDAITDLLPHVEVLEAVSGTFYEDDPFARGGWPLLKSGQLSRFAPHETFVKPEGRVVFATADISALWSSFIDGAIESGLRAGRDVRGILRAGGHTHAAPAIRQ